MHSHPEAHIYREDSAGIMLASVRIQNQPGIEACLSVHDDACGTQTMALNDWGCVTAGPIDHAYTTPHPDTHPDTNTGILKPRLDAPGVNRAIPLQIHTYKQGTDWNERMCPLRRGLRFSRANHPR